MAFHRNESGLVTWEKIRRQWCKAFGEFKEEKEEMSAVCTRRSWWRP